MEKIKLTEFTKGGGCGCKIPPSELSEILSGQKTSTEFGLIEGNSNGDDAAVWDMGNGQLLISTTDFFTPIVDDPFDFGRIAAANSISDIYAMGGRPIMALSVLAWPTDKLGNEIAAEVIRGARTVCTEAGIAIGGGHSIVNPEPVFGLAVNGLVSKENLKTNHNAKEGDQLFLTKPIGSGMLSTAMKRGMLKNELLVELIAYLTTLNKSGELIGKIESVNAMTDVTGFGLIGHLNEMTIGSNLTAKLNYGDIPLMNGVKELAAQMVYPNNTMRNWKAFNENVSGVSGESLLTLCDPQTNGGLLIAIRPEGISELKELFQSVGQSYFHIGELTAYTGMNVEIKA